MTVGTGGTVVLEAVAFPTVGMRPSVEGGDPGVGVVALVTRATSEQSGVVRGISMTAGASRWSTFEHVIDVATGASHASMLAG